MTTNAGFEYGNAVEKYQEAKNDEEKLIDRDSVYQMMRENWKIYCLMSAIIYIEEMKKPKPHIQVKKHKDKIYNCLCFSSLVLKMKDKEFLDEFLEITNKWGDKLNKNFVGPSFNSVKIDNYSQHFKIILSPTWLGYILKECGKIPNEYSFGHGINRIKFIKQKRNEKVDIDHTKNLFNLLLRNKTLAAGAFIVSFDLEFRGIQTGSPSLCMSDTFKDFLEFMLKVAQKWQWTNNKTLSPVSIEYSKSLGINASPQYEFRINISGLCEIYKLAGPLAIRDKDKCINFHVNRSTNYKNLGWGLLKNNTKNKILSAVKTNKNITTTDLQFIAGVRVDVVLDHLRNLETENLVKKERNGKGYFWNIK